MIGQTVYHYCLLEKPGSGRGVVYEPESSTRCARNPSPSLSLFLGMMAALLWVPSAYPQEDAKAQVNPSAEQTTRRPKRPAADASTLASPAPIRRWPPSNVDDTVPAVAADVSCPLPRVLQAATERVKELVTNLQQFTATERIEHQEVDKAGNFHSPKTRSFAYLVTIEEIRPRVLNVEETRNASTSPKLFPAGWATWGLSVLALVFHPYFIEEYSMTCEGLGQWQGQPAWQVRFQQRPDKPIRIRGYRVGGRWYPVKLKGRAWIAADSFQLLHLESDLLEPVPEIHLLSEHLAIEYRPVRFQKQKLELWLPQSADLYVDLVSLRYYRRHSFSDFQLFSVDVTQQIHDQNDLQAAKQSSEPASPPNTAVTLGGTANRSTSSQADRDRTIEEGSGYIGVSGTSEGSYGVRITQITADGPAAQAGLKVGDIITALDHTPVKIAQILDAEIALRKPGSKVRISYIRSSMQGEVTVTVGKRVMP